jgi:hypothetical protein
MFGGDFGDFDEGFYDGGNRFGQGGHGYFGNQRYRRPYRNLGIMDGVAMEVVMMAGEGGTFVLILMMRMRSRHRQMLLLILMMRL